MRLKVGFHYPSSRAELTARKLGCIFWHPSTRAVNSGSGNRTPVYTARVFSLLSLSAAATNVTRHTGNFNQLTARSSCYLQTSLLFHVRLPGMLLLTSMTTIPLDCVPLVQPLLACLYVYAFLVLFVSYCKTGIFIQLRTNNETWQCLPREKLRTASLWKWNTMYEPDTPTAVTDDNRRLKPGFHSNAIACVE